MSGPLPTRRGPLRVCGGGTSSCPRTRVPRGEEVGRGLSRASGMDSCSPFRRGQASQERRWNVAGKTVEPRRARASGYPEGGDGAGLLPRPRDGFLLPVSTRTSFAGKTVERRRKDGGASSCPRKRVPRRGRWGEASPAPQGWIPAPRFHEDKLRRKDGGASSSRVGAVREPPLQDRRWQPRMGKSSQFPLMGVL